MAEQPPQPAAVTVVTETRNLKTSVFIHADDQIATGQAWEEWLEGIEREFRYFKITDSADKKDALIIYGGKEIARLEKSLPNPAQADLSEYDKLKTKLNNYFTPRKNKHHARYLFARMRPGSGETTAAYAARLREKAHECEFGGNLEERILEHLIQTIESRILIQKTINKKWNLTRLLTEATQMEDTSLQIRDMKSPDAVQVSRVKQQPRFRQERPQRARGPSRGRPATLKSQSCGYCGRTGTHPEGRDCPAYGKKCNKCNKLNHFATVCRGDTPRKSSHTPTYKPKRPEERRGQIKKTTEREHDSSTSSDDEFFNQAVHHLKRARKVKEASTMDRLLTIRIDDVDVQVEPDSGADVNIMDEHQFKALTHRSNQPPTLEVSQTKLSTLQNALPVKGEFKTVIRNKTRGIAAKFIVVKGRINSPPLIGKDSLDELGMLQICQDGSFAQINELRIPDQSPGIKAVTRDKATTDKIAAVTDQYSHIFDGIGKIEDTKNGKEIYARFSMKQGAVPVAQKPRQVAYYLQEPLKKWLEEGIKEEIFEEVPQGEPVTWCSPLVVQPKPRFSKVPKEKLEPHMIRASVDLRIPNKFMERNRITQGPVVEDFTYKFHDCIVFSKLDMKQGYHQLMLHPESRAVATFSTPWGNMRPKRLIFGAKSSQDLFDEAIYRIFGDIPKCLNQRDDILLGGRDMEEHNRTLETVLKRAADFGITFNKDKCQFGVEEIEFYGYRFTKNGLKPTPDKVRAVKESHPPRTKEAVRSFLGMIGYLSKFIPRYSSLTAPLRELTHKNTQFRWGAEEAAAFETLKESITNEDTMAYFNPSRPIVLRVEASYHEGLSAGLFQTTDKGLQPVHFISRTMTETEKRYSQTEKDALSVRWAKNRFSMYLLGAPKFKIITAHKPLIPMFTKPTARLPPRIEKWVMDMQDVDYEMVYEPGKDEADPLDFLSRHPLPETGTDSTEKVIKQVITTEHAVVLDRIREETLQDHQLQKVNQRILTNDWEHHKKDPDLAPFYLVRQELYSAEGMIFKMHQIIVPRNLQRKVIKAAHSLGHLGMTKTKQMLREKYWFPTMNSMVEEIIGQCYQCQVTTKQHRQEPIKMTPIPKKPWDVVAVDFGGPYPDGHYNLVAVDKRTRYPEVQQTHSTAFKPTKRGLKTMFATHGTPRQLESDNGPPFNSREFAEFANEEGFSHHRVTPEHARANGEAESFMKMLNKTEQISHFQGEDNQTAIQNMLTGYRSTPHPATGVTPYEALMNRQVRTKLDHQHRNEGMNSMRDIAVNERDEAYKDKLKRNAENRNTRRHTFIIGDYVLLKQTKKNKWSTAYEPAFYTIYRIDGSSIAARRVTDGREICRDASRFKPVNAVVQNMEEIPESGNAEPASDDWRESLLSSANPEPVGPVEPAEPVGMCIAEETTMSTPQKPAPKKTPGTNLRPQRVKRRPTYLGDYTV